MRADAATFEHVDPALVGNAPRRARSPSSSGKGTVTEKAAAAGHRRSTTTPPQRVVERVKELEHGGFQFEAADGSFELLMRKEAGDYEPLFRLESWRVIVEQRADGKVETEATIKIWVDGERYVRTAEGNGPVNALDTALRDAIGEIHPHLRDIELVNFKVRILDETKGTGAVTRVLIDASDGHDVWGSIGVSENVIAASWDALVDSLEYGDAARRAGRGAGSATPTARGADVARASRSRSPGPSSGEAEEARGASRCCARASSRSGPRVPAFERGVRRARSARAHASAVSQRHRRPAPRAARRRRGATATRSSRRPFSFVASANAVALRARAAGVRRHRPGDAEPRPATPPRPRSPSARRRCCRCTSSATRPTCPRSRRIAALADRRGRLRGARRASRRRHARSARAATRRCSASTPTSS